MRTVLVLILLSAVGYERSLPQELPPKNVVNIPLDAISLEKARELDGSKVTASLLIAKPSFTWKGKTIVGGPDHFDGIERGIVMEGGHPLTRKEIIRALKDAKSEHGIGAVAEALAVRSRPGRTANWLRALSPLAMC